MYDCNVAGTVALTYDDGPYIYTNDILDIFAKYNAKATFFITGNNNGKGEIDNSANAWPAVIKRMYSDGHQIASHTWSHQDLSAITSAQRKQQMTYNEMALRNILGFFPTYMRPPYSSCNGACQADMGSLGYHITYFDIDTDDYNQDSPSKIQNSKNWFSGNLTGAASANDYLVIGHDIHEQTAHNLTEYMLQTLQARGYRAVTVGECLGDDAANWYRSSSGSVATSAASSIASSTSKTSSKTSSASTSSATKVSGDGSCGPASGQTCQGSTYGNCCSQYGFCGSTADYCTNCQPGFGTCGSASVSSKVAVVSTRSSSAAPAASATKVSTTGSCGSSAGLTCRGSSFGNCCSQYGKYIFLRR